MRHWEPETATAAPSSETGWASSDVDLLVGGGATMHIEEPAKYLVPARLGSIIHRDGMDTADVDARIRSARSAFRALRQCLFARKDVTLEGSKRAVYTALILSVLLYGSESRVLTEELWGELLLSAHFFLLFFLEGEGGRFIPVLF
jgi:hypothetical protein